MTEVVGSARLNVEADIDTDSIEDAGGEAAEAFGQSFEKTLRNVGIGVAAAGALMEGLARSVQGTEVALIRASQATGINRDELRNLAIDTANVTFDLEDVVAVFDSLGRAGIESAEDLQRVANVWDMVADATGANVVSLASAATELQAFGIAAEAPEEALDAFGAVAFRTQDGVEGLVDFLQRSAPRLAEFDLHVDDVAAGLLALDEAGIRGARGQREFQRAIEAADGDLSAALETLGISGEKFDEMRDSIEGSSAALEESAEQFEGTFTPIQRLEAFLEGLQQRFGGIIGPIGAVAGALSGIGIAMIGLSALGPVIAAISAPILIAVGVVAALVAGIALLWRESETFRTVVRTLGETLRTVFVDVILPAVAAFVAFVRDELWPIIRETAAQVLENLQPAFDSIAEVIRNDVIPIVQAIAEKFVEWWPTIQEVIKVIVRLQGDILAFAGAVLGKVIPIIVAFYRDHLVRTFRAIGTVIDVVRRVIGTFRDFGNRVADTARTVRDRTNDIVARFRSMRDSIRGFLEGLQGMMRGVWDPLASGAAVTADAIRTIFNRVIDSVNVAIRAINVIPGVDVGQVPRLATGGTILQDGWALVGERGPELVHLGAGSTVFDARQTAGAMAPAGGGVPVVQVFIDGQEFRGMIRVQQQQRDRALRRSLVGGTAGVTA